MQQGKGSPVSRVATWIGGATVLGAGLVFGAFASRVLAEAPWVRPPFYRWPLVTALTLGVGAAFVVAWSLVRRRPDAWASSAPFVPAYLLLLYLLQPELSLLQAGALLGGAMALAVLLGARRRQWGSGSQWSIAFLLTLVPLAFYLSTLAPGVGQRDGYELQAASATLGFAHPTGYPLFPILGHLWIALFPFGTVAWRINALCALYAAASIPLLYGTARQAIGASPRAAQPFAAWSALIAAFSHTLWAQASQPEKYTLNALFVSLVLYLALGSVDPQERGPHPHLRWLALAYGLSLTHHRTMLMLAPALALYLLWRDPGLLKRPRQWLPALGLALVPLLIYLYIPWRAHAQGWAMTLPEFLRYIAGTYYGPAVRPLDWLSADRVHMFWRFLVRQFGYSGIGLGVLGLIGLSLRRRWRFLACSVLAYGAYYVWGTVWYAYYNDVNSFIPNHMIYAIWIGSGALTIWQGLKRLLRAVRRPASPREGQAQDTHRQARDVLRQAQDALGGSSRLQAVFWSLAGLLPLWMIWTHAPQVDMSDAWGLTRWGEAVITRLDIAPQATILADREKHPPLDYFSRVEGRRPDLDVVILGDEGAYLDRLAQDLAQGKTVYLARFLPGLDGPYHLRSLGPLVEVGTGPAVEPDAIQGPTAQFSDQVRLLGYQAGPLIGSASAGTPRPLDPGGSMDLTLYWQALSPVAGNYQVHLQLVSRSGEVWWSAGDHPVAGMYPTAAWKPPEVVADWHEVPIPRTVPPGEYTVEVGLFPPFAQEGLRTADGQTWLPLCTLQVAPLGAMPPIPQPLRVVAPGRWQILGYDLAAQAPPTGRVPLTLYWQPLARLPDYEIGTRLTTSQGSGEWTWARPFADEYPSSLWPPGQAVLTQHLLTMPPEQGEAVVEVAVREARPTGDGPRVPVFPRWLAGQTMTLALPPLTVAGYPPAAPGTANYGDRILLLSTDLGQRTLPPGAPLQFTVRWQALRDMEADYTLFVQLLAPDGTLRGQIDVWPKDGTHPTSQWAVGEIVEDRYTVYVAQDASPGRYQVLIGWYLLETMQRLPLLDESGDAVDDKLSLPALTVQ